jgi:hypothetical protein
MILKKVKILFGFFLIFVACETSSEKKFDVSEGNNFTEEEVPDILYELEEDFLERDTEDAENEILEVEDIGPMDLDVELDVTEDVDIQNSSDLPGDTAQDVPSDLTYQECLARYHDVVQRALQDQPDVPEPPPDETPDTFTHLSLGENHGCALHTDGSLYCWGDNRYRQSEPPTEGRFVQVVSRRNTSCALEDTGRAVCWGEESNNEIPGLYRQIAVGCGIRVDGSAYCWNFSRNTDRVIEGSYTYIGLHEVLCLVNDQNKGRCIDYLGYIIENVPDIDFISIQIGRFLSCGETTDHQLLCWSEEYALRRAPIRLYKIKNEFNYVAIYQDNSFSWENSYRSDLSSYNLLDRSQFIDIDTNETQHCAIDGQGLLQCWTKEGRKKQNLLYDRFLDYDFGCAVMQDHTLYCEEGSGDHFSNNTNILFDSINTRGLNMAVSTDQDVYYFQNTFEGEENEYDLYYFQGPFENILNEFEYFCGTLGNGEINCQCLCYPGINHCTPDCNSNARYFYENYYHVNDNCGINRNGIIDCWYFNDLSSVQHESENKYIYLNNEGTAACGITCEGHIDCLGNQNYQNNSIFKFITSYGFSNEQYFCSIDVFGKLLCENDYNFYSAHGKFVKLSSNLDTLCAQRENGSVVCFGNKKGGK